MVTISNTIAGLDLEPVAYKVCRDEGWPVEQVDRVEHEYRQFLQLILDAGKDDRIAPTRAIDIFWHHHILDTAKYFADCDTVFGTYLHHYPYSGIFGDDDHARQSDRVRFTRNAIDAPQTQGE